MPSFITIIVAKVLSFFITFGQLGSGSTWPGHIALKLNKNFIKESLKGSKVRVILIAGTNGKTTTSTLIKYILRKNNYRVFQNEEGANLLNGIASAIVRNKSIFGKLTYDFALFEIDENVLPSALDQISPYAIILLNLFRDQLDRYGEVNTIAYKWSNSLNKLSKGTNVIINGDDPQLYFIGSKLNSHVSYFGLADNIMEKKAIPHDVDSVYCPQCKSKLIYKKMSYSHLGDFYCNHCDFNRQNIISYPVASYKRNLKGIYNYYNISSVLTLTKDILGLSEDQLIPHLSTFTPAFGRQEEIDYLDRKITLILSKNPTGFNQSIESVKEIIDKKATFFVALNDRIPDGTDISWIWDVEFQEILPLASKIIISGDRTFDMALRFKYCLEHDESVTIDNNQYTFNSITAIPHLKQALEFAVNNVKKGERLIVLATYSAMLETREILVRRRLL